MRPIAARSARASATGPIEQRALWSRDSTGCWRARPHPRVFQRAHSRELLQPAEDGKMGGIEPGRLVANFAEGRLHHLLGGDGIAQDAEVQGAEADRGAARTGPPG